MQYKISDKISVPILLNYQYGISDIKNQAISIYSNSTGKSELYWADGASNLTNPYHNSSIGILVGLKYTL